MTTSSNASPLSTLRNELDLMRNRGTVVTATLAKEIAKIVGVGEISDQLAEELAKPPPARKPAVGRVITDDDRSEWGSRRGGLGFY